MIPSTMAHCQIWRVMVCAPTVRPYTINAASNPKMDPDAPTDQLRQDVCELLDQLEQQGLVQPASVPA